MSINTLSIRPVDTANIYCRGSSRRSHRNSRHCHKNPENLCQKTYVKRSRKTVCCLMGWKKSGKISEQRLELNNQEVLLHIEFNFCKAQLQFQLQLGLSWSACPAIHPPPTKKSLKWQLQTIFFKRQLVLLYEKLKKYFGSYLQPKKSGITPKTAT